jgi:hydroxymethylpyrimidine pyrophosphatase-like HAD family hydrolase
VSNARQEVIAAAKHTCAPYWENGVLSVLKSFL